MNNSQREESVKDKIAILRRTSHTLSTLSDEPIPRSLDENQAREARKYSTWLRRASEELESLASRGEREAATLYRSTEEMQQINASFNLLYLQLQQRMQQENRQFTMISNIMKNKHDTVKNTINNIR